MENRDIKNRNVKVIALIVLMWHGMMQMRNAVLPIIKYFLFSLEIKPIYVYLWYEFINVFFFISVIFLLLKLTFNYAKYNQLLIIVFIFYIMSFFLGFFLDDILMQLKSPEIEIREDKFYDFFYSSLVFGYIHTFIEVLVLFILFFVSIFSSKTISKQ